MYLSPAVRTIREDPTPDVEMRLVVRGVDGASREAVAAAVEDRGGVVERETRFGNLHVTVEEPAVAGLLEALPSSVRAVETVTPELSGDAGEDVESPAGEPAGGGNGADER